ncbi:hypothetical protein SmJEL517_g05522 [Synchytrium microbalum]|uniref:YCII-related domain-containing protein n=1 Tax=Synchytrium microbalum TaxID=1806994 RepID=A0A507BNP4_9FUNG|nr:uncharacterized protein SmJEL517_g05522 [Synchytrium microbalum]TPX31077.1 hypothetical protein SmJEL517_g05522 [Synchytrium microbalum]
MASILTCKRRGYASLKLIQTASFSSSRSVGQTWALIAPDYKDSLAKRMAVREQHLHRAKTDTNLILGGAMLDKQDGNMTGSLLVFDAPTKEAAERFVKEDPYIGGQVWDREKYQLIPIKVAILNKK